MPTNRIRACQATQNRPGQGPTPGIPAGFVVTPAFFIAAASQWQWQVYQAAYEQARRAAAVPRHYRRFFAVWN
ncbi:MAG TPA: hypothetical protein VHY91_09945 [Pirellulales bacterium]|jgi:hypothetical protein|nr:hypothetical protein [Pirellulales bacterium]